MSNTKITINENKEDNNKKKPQNEPKKRIDLNKVKTIMSVKANDKTEKENDEEGNNDSTGIKKAIISLSKIKSIKKTLKNSSYKFLDFLGDIEDAKTHRNSNIPLKKVGEFKENTVFCQCCGLPSEQEGVMEKYKYSDSTDEFIKSGQAVSLYFSFYIYSILILLIAFLTISLPSLIISYNRSDELNKICNKIYAKKKIEECKIYLDHADNIEDENKSSFNFILDFSGLNIKNYRIIHEILTQNENKNLDDIFVNYSILNFIGILTILLIYFGYIILMNNKSYIPDIDILSPKNYSIMITGMDGFFPYLRTQTNYLSITKDSDNKENNTDEIKQPSERESIDEKSVTGVKKFENLFKEKISELFLNDNKKYIIEKVNICFKINKYIELSEKLDKCIEIESLIHSPYQKMKNLKTPKSERLYYYSPLSDFNIHICERTKKLSDIQKEKKEIEKQINQLQEEAKEINMEKFAGAVIVSFSSIKEKEEFLSHVPKSFLHLLLRIIGKLRYFFCFCCIDKIDNTKFVMRYIKINIEEAPNPEDIIFENLEFPSQSKVYRVVGINMISLLLIAIGFGIILGLQQLQIYVNKKDYSKIIYYIISLLITIVSSIINIIFEELLDMLTKHEKQNSISNYYLSYSLKLTIFSFCIKGIIPLVVEKILGTTNYEILITNMLTMFLVNSIITPLIWTLNISPAYWIKKLEICLIEKNSMRYLNLNQKKLNELYEKSDMKIAEKYSYIAKTLLMTFLYISIFPFGVLISLGGFILCYLLEKYNYINNYKRPEILNNTLFFFYVDYFIIILFCLGIGDYIFLSDVFSHKIWSLVNIIFLGVLIIIPYNHFFNHDFIGFKESEINKISYEDSYLEFHIDYERINPMAKEEGIKNYIEKLYEKKLIEKDQRDKLLKDFSSINLMNVYYQNRNNRNNLKIQKSMIMTAATKPLSKSVLPNQKNLFKLSSIYSSFINNKNQNKQKKFVNQSQMVNPFYSSNKLKGNDLLLVNSNSNNNSDNRENMYLKRDSKLNKIEEIKEEEESNQEEEIESIDKKGKLNKAIVKKENQRKSEEQKMKKSVRIGQRQNFKDYYNNSLMFRICGSMQVFNYLQRDEDEDDDNEFFENEEEVEEEEISQLDKNINNFEDIKINDNNH